MNSEFSEIETFQEVREITQATVMKYEDMNRNERKVSFPVMYLVNVLPHGV